MYRNGRRGNEFSTIMLMPLSFVLCKMCDSRREFGTALYREINRVTITV